MARTRGLLERLWAKDAECPKDRSRDRREDCVCSRPGLLPWLVFGVLAAAYVLLALDATGERLFGSLGLARVSVAWLLLFLVLLWGAMVVGWLLRCTPWGTFVNGRNLVSLARLQFVLWFCMLLSGTIVALFYGDVELLKDPDALAQGGLSVTALAGAATIVGGKKRLDADPRHLVQPARTMARRFSTAYYADIAEAASEHHDQLQAAGRQAARHGPRTAGLSASSAPPAQPPAPKPAKVAEGLAERVRPSLEAAQRDPLFPTRPAARTAPAMPSAFGPHGERGITRAYEAIAAASRGRDPHLAAAAIHDYARGIARDNVRLGKGVTDELVAGVYRTLDEVGVSPEELQAALEAWTLDDLRQSPGLIYENKRPCEARLLDLVEGDQLADAGELDIAKAQMLLTTLLGLATYGVLLWNAFRTGGDADYPTELLGLMAFSSAAYLGNKLPNQTRPL